LIYELNHFGIVIRDLDASLDFYQGALGAKEVFRGFIPASQTDIVYLQIAGGMIELLHRADPPADERFGITHIAFSTDSLDADYAALVEAGHRGLVAPKAAGTGVGRLAFVEDPNGARVELLERDVTMRSGIVEHEIVKAFDHYSVVANDRDGALKFYRDGLGMSQLTTLSVEATSLSIDYLNYDYDVLELLHRPTRNDGPIFGHIALRVSDVGTALNVFRERGITIDAGAPKPAGTGLGMIGTIRDPDGVGVELVDRQDLHEL
jgi:catechol 2,3-dioxygenase-like lactoylglutathione lyase family enzyme